MVESILSNVVRMETTSRMRIYFEAATVAVRWLPITPVTKQLLYLAHQYKISVVVRKLVLKCHM